MFREVARKCKIKNKRRQKKSLRLVGGAKGVDNGGVEGAQKEHLLRLGLARDPLQLAWQLYLAETMAVKE